MHAPKTIPDTIIDVFGEPGARHKDKEQDVKQDQHDHNAEYLR